jgi:uncharacterized membrane protein
MKYFIPLIILNLFLFVACKPGDSPEVSFGEGEQLSYNFHIRPILSDKCFACHGPDANKQEAGLRLDTPETAFAALKESPGKFAIIPKDVNSSELYHRIVSTDPNELMPPPESNLSLTAEEIAMIKKWIEQGAQYEPIGLL